MVKEDLSGSFVVKAFSWDMIDFMGEHGDIFITKGRYISSQWKIAAQSAVHIFDAAFLPRRGGVCACVPPPLAGGGQGAGDKKSGRGDKKSGRENPCMHSVNSLVTILY
jgi:hypothetical protein